MKRVGLCVCLAILAAASAAHANISWDFNYTDAAGTGFNDPVDGPARQAAMLAAANQFSDMFASDFTNSATIDLDVKSEDNPFDGVLASCIGGDTWGGSEGFTLGETVRHKLQVGGDLNGTTADALVSVNFAQPWELDPNVTPDASHYDFYSTLDHEFTHALGFASSISEEGHSPFGYNYNEWALYDSFLKTAAGEPVIDPITFATNIPLWFSNKTGGPSPAGGIFFWGPDAMAANGGKPVGLFSPSPWQNGSSISHIDDMNPDYAGYLMLAAVGTGPSARSYSDIEIGMLQDLGYTRTQSEDVPEPGTCGLFLVGLALLKVSRRRAAPSVN